MLIGVVAVLMHLPQLNILLLLVVVVEVMVVVLVVVLADTVPLLRLQLHQEVRLP
jgi:hypothetical protein